MPAATSARPSSYGPLLTPPAGVIPVFDGGVAAASRYRALLEQSPVAVHVFDLRGQTVAVNPAFERLFGITAEQAMRYNILEDPQPAANGTLDLLRRTFAGEVTRSAPVCHDARTVLGVGRAPWVEVTAYPVRDAAGVVREVVLLAEDVTERVEAARATAAAVARADALLAVTGALVEAATPEDVARVVVAHAATALGAARGAVALLADAAAGPVLEIVASTGYGEAAVIEYRRFPLAAAFPLSDVARSGEPMFLATDAARRARYPHLGHLSDQNGGGAMAAVPLVARPTADRGPRVVGALGFNFAEERAFTPEERALLTALAQQCAQAVERAQLYAAERAARAEAEAARQRAE